MSANLPVVRVTNRLTLGLILILWVCDGRTAAAQSLSPVLPLTASSRSLPMFESAMRDPGLTNSQVKDGIAADSIKNEISEFKSDLTRAKGARRTDILKRLYENHVILADYYADVVDGTLTKEGNPVTRHDLTNARQGVVRYAGLYARVTKQKRKAAQANYHRYLNQYLLGVQTKAVAGMTKQKHLSAHLQRRAEMLVAIHHLHRGNKSQQAAAQRKLAALIRPLPLKAAIIARLALARKLAGLNSKGRRFKTADRRYRTYLYAATQRARNLSEMQKSAVMSFASDVWQKAEAKKDGFQRPPLLLSAYTDLKLVDAIRERQAMTTYKLGKHSAALKSYQRLAKKYEGNLLSAQFDERVLIIQKARYRKSKSPRTYEASLTGLKSKYNDTQVLGNRGESRAKAMGTKIDRNHQILVDREISLAKRKAATRRQKTQSIGVVSRYVNTLTDDGKRERYTAAYKSSRHLHRSLPKR